MAESTELKRQNLEGGEGSEPPSSAEKKQKLAEVGGSEPPSLAEKSKNGSEPPSSSPEKGGQNPEACWINPLDACAEQHYYSAFVRDMDEIMPEGALKEHVPDFFKIWMNYKRQTYDSNGFDCDYYPCGSFSTLLYPVINPNTAEAELMMELANLAIQEYNEKECNVFKYKVLKIEKANFMLTSLYQYRMTVTVLNLTLGTTIETFQIFAAKFIFRPHVKEVLICQPKDGTKRKGGFAFDVSKPKPKPNGEECHRSNGKGT